MSCGTSLRPGPCTARKFQRARPHTAPSELFHDRCTRCSSPPRPASRGLDVDVLFQLKQHREQLSEERGSILRGIEEALMLTNRRQIASADAASVPKTFSGAMSW